MNRVMAALCAIAAASLFASCVRYPYYYSSAKPASTCPYRRPAKR